jgi:hypothetical protein
VKDVSGSQYTGFRPARASLVNATTPLTAAAAAIAERPKRPRNWRRETLLATRSAA